MTYSLPGEGSGKISERALGDHQPGAQLTSSIKVVSSSTASGNRTVVLSRPLKGMTAAHFTFTPGAVNLPIINAVGSSSAFGIHKAKTAANIYILPSGVRLCCIMCIVLQDWLFLLTPLLLFFFFFLVSFCARFPDCWAVKWLVDQGKNGACVCASKPVPFGQGKGSLVYTPNSVSAVHKQAASCL